MARTDPEALRLELTTIHDVGGVDPATRRTVSAKTVDVESASVALRDALGELHAADEAAWQRYAQDLESATLRFDAALVMAAATLRAEQAASKPDLEETLDTVSRSWRGQADEIRLQTHLGEMDARDAGLHAIDDLEAAGHRVAQVLTTLRTDAGESLGSLRHAAGDAIGGIAHALQGLRPARPDQPARER